eukprot:3854759-Rhodomonas_salina.2
MQGRRGDLRGDMRAAHREPEPCVSLSGAAACPQMFSPPAYSVQVPVTLLPFADVLKNQSIAIVVQDAALTSSAARICPHVTYCFLTVLTYGMPCSCRRAGRRMAGIRSETEDTSP